MKTGKRPWRRASWCAGMLAGWWAQGAAATSYYWRGDTSSSGTNDYSAAANWSGAVPGAGDYAYFSGAGDYPIPTESVFTVQWSEDITVARTYFEQGSYEITLDLDGHAFTNTGLFYINGEGPSGIVVNLTGGEAEVDGYLSANTVGTTGTLNLYGEGTFFRAAGSTSPKVGSRGTGTMHVAGGAVYTSTRTTYVGGDAGSHGTLHVGNGGAFTNLSLHIWIGDYGSAHLLIEGGGQVVSMATTSQILFGLRGGTDQAVTALITGEGSLLGNHGVTSADRGIFIGGDHAGNNLTKGSVEVTVADRARMESNRRIGVWNGHVLAVDNGTVAAETDFFASDESRLDLTIYTAAREALIQAGGDVILGGNVELVLDLGTAAGFSIGQFVELIRYGGTLHDGFGGDGRFSNYAQDQEFELSDFEFRFDYAYQPEAEGPAYIGLHVIPEPGVLVLLGLAGILLWKRRFG